MLFLKKSKVVSAESQREESLKRETRGTPEGNTEVKRKIGKEDLLLRIRERVGRRRSAFGRERKE